MGTSTAAKRIGVFFDAPGYDEYPFNTEEYVVAYHEVAALIHERGARFHIVRSLETFLGGNRFKGHWEFDGAAFQRNDAEIELDLIYDKGYFVGDARSRLLNDAEMNRICVDKRETVRMFPDISPKTLEVNNAQALERALDDWPSPTIVAKPVDGAEAKGVVIGSRDDVLAAKHVYPIILQQFVDTSGGIPGIVEGVCDLRTIMIDGEVGLTYARQAKKGTLISNVSKGGKEIEVLPEQRPPEVIEIAKDIDRRFQAMSKHRVFSADMAPDKDGKWYLIELNSKPGLSPRSFGPTYPRYQELLVNALISAASA